MNFVLDTNAVSETRKPRPNTGFVTWLAAQDPVSSFAAELHRKFRVLNFDSRAAAMWGEMTAHARGPLPLRDSFIAAIVRSRGQRIVTRDTGPFERMGCKAVDPWK